MAAYDFDSDTLPPPTDSESEISTVLDVFDQLQETETNSDSLRSYEEIELSDTRAHAVFDREEAHVVVVGQNALQFDDRELFEYEFMTPKKPFHPLGVVCPGAPYRPLQPPGLMRQVTNDNLTDLTLDVEPQLDF